MSSTARGSQRSPADFYGTPSWPLYRLLERVALPKGLWLESSAGEGGIIKAVNDFCRGCPNLITWDAHELREECRKPLLDAGVHSSRLTIGSFLDVPAPPFYTHKVSINNTPFSLAQEFIEHTLKFAPYVVHLLRLNYLGTEKRNEFFKNNMPDVYVVPDRISFTNDGKADSIEYMFAVFGPERGRRTGRIEVLDHTPVEQRR